MLRRMEEWLQERNAVRRLLMESGISLILRLAESEEKMTKQEAYKSFRCWHCSYRYSDSGECLCGDPDDENCPRDMGEPEGIEE